MKINVLPICLSFSVLAAFGELPDRPDDLSFPKKTSVTEAGEYAVSGVGNEIVLSGTISGNVTITADQICRVTLCNVTLSGQLAIEGEAILWATGASTLENGGKSVVTSTGALMLAGEGAATLTGGGAKKTKAVIYSGDALTIVSGTWNVNMTLATEAKGFGIAATKKLKMSAGSVSVVSACTTYKDTGVYSDKKNIEISGGILRVTQYGPKSIALNTDDEDASVKLTGGAVILNVGGAGAKGIKCDGTFEMSGGILNASVSGGPLYEAYEYGDGTNLVVTTTKAAIVESGTYLIEDVTSSAAVKCGTVKVSGGTVRITADGICSRGLVADTTLDLSGGVFDIQANGNASEPVIDLVTDNILTKVELDRKTASCIKQGDTTGTAKITGGTFYLVATNYGGKCFSIDGALTVGTSGATTLPTDTSFAPDIQCSTFGQKLHVAAQKLSTYTTLGKAVATTNISSAILLRQNTSRIVSGRDEDADYTNPKCIKCEGDIAFMSGRLRMYSKCDGGEGLESKANLTINGGILEGTCYDDVIQSANTITVNGGYLYCGSTNNDGIDANGTIIINGGVVLAFTLTSPEVGIDVDNANNLKINGGIVLAVGCASSTHATRSTGLQSSYLNAYTSLLPYADKYLNIAGSYWVKVPATRFSGGICSLMCSSPGCTGSAPSTATTPTSGTAIGFHGVFADEQPGTQQPDEGEQQPNATGIAGCAFIYDTFITESTGVGIDVRNGSWISTDRTKANIISNSNLVEMVVGAAAGSIALTNVDLRMSVALTEIPSCAFAGCENLESVVLPTSVKDVASDAFIGCPKLKSISYIDATTDPVTPDQPILPDSPVIPNPPVGPVQPVTPDDQPEEPIEPESQGVSFENELIETTEGNSLIVRVKGGCANVASSVKLCLSYQTASASDLNLAKGSIDGVRKNLTFPLTLTWNAGEVLTHEISIPVKTDSGKEVDEQLTFQLASAKNCDLGNTPICTALLHDAKDSSASVLPLAYGLAEPADAGRITGATRKTIGKGITLSASANKEYVFVGWYDGSVCVSQTAKLKFMMPSDGVCYTARFATKEEDVSAISCSLAGYDLSSEDSISVSNTCGVRVSYPIAASGLSKVTVSASGLPMGMKLFCDKSTGLYSVEGIPTSASTKNTRFTVTSAGKSKRTFVVSWIIGALPNSAVGTWNGTAWFAGEDEYLSPEGTFALTATAAGKISAKAVTGIGSARFSGKGWSEDTDGTLWMTMTNKTYGILCVQLNPQADSENSLSANITGGKFGDDVLKISAWQNLPQIQ